LEAKVRLRFLDDIHRLRKHARLTQLGLANVIGSTQANVSMLERGLGNPTAESLYAIADALDAEIVFVPRKILKPVMAEIDSHLNPARSEQRPLGSPIDDLLIADDDEPDDSGERAPRGRKR
jgi:transcriptional regulator with XRE-family HTH domain